MTSLYSAAHLGLGQLSLSNWANKGFKAVGQLGASGSTLHVNVAKGNLVIHEKDLFLSSKAGRFGLSQYYNTQAKNWHQAELSSLHFEGTSQSGGMTIKRERGDGDLETFVFNARIQAYVSSEGQASTIRCVEGTFVYSADNESCQSYYSAQGQLIYKQDKDGHRIDFEYENGQLRAIVLQQSNQKLEWVFQNHLLTAAKMWENNQVIAEYDYLYDSLSRLVHVKRQLDSRVYEMHYSYHDNTHLISSVSESDGSAVWFNYDKEGRITEIIDGEGRKSFFSYQEGVTEVRHGDGKSWYYRYDTNNQLTAVEGPDHFAMQFRYERGYLTEVIEGTQHWRMEYNEYGDCYWIQKPSGEIVLRTFDDAHHVLSESLIPRDGASPLSRSVYLYDDKGHLRYEMSPGGVVRAYEYNKDGLLTATRVYLGALFELKIDAPIPTLEEMATWTDAHAAARVALTEYVYDWRGQQIMERHYTHVDEKGQGIDDASVLQTDYVYDAFGCLRESSIVGRSGVDKTYYFYDTMMRLIKKVDAMGRVHEYEYDDAHHRLIETDEKGLKTISIYDKSGALILKEKCSASQSYGIERFEYNSRGLLSVSVDVYGKKTYYEYNDRDDLILKVDGQGHAISYKYNDDGLCIGVHEYARAIDVSGASLTGVTSLTSFLVADPNDRISSSVYNAYQQLAYEIHADGSVTGYLYDALGQLFEKRAYATRLEWPVEGDSPAIPAPAALDRFTRYFYDKDGHVVAQCNQSGEIEAYTYNALGLVTSTRLMVRTRPDLMVDLADLDDYFHANDRISYQFYDNQGRKIGEIDAERFCSAWRYDERGLLQESIQYYQATEAAIGADFDETAFAQLLPSAHQNDRHTYYEYDHNQALIEERTANTRVLYQYDTKGNLIEKATLSQHTNAMRAMLYRYDALGRVVAKLNPIGAAMIAKAKDEAECDAIWAQYSERYAYDLSGRLISTTNALGARELYVYDDDCRQTITLSAEGAVSYLQYDAFGQVISKHQLARAFKQRPADLLTLRAFIEKEQSSSDQVTSYEYNTLGQVISTRDASGVLTVNAFNSFGDLVVRRQYHQQALLLVDEWQYDLSGLLVSEIKDALSVQAQTTRQYNRFGELTLLQGPMGQRVLYDYNARGEMVHQSNGLHDESYMSYDAFGRLLWVSGQKNAFYLYDDLNRIQMMRGASGEEILTEFDDFGDKITWVDARGYKTIFTYDADGRLVHVEKPEGHTIDYTYDRAGRLTLSAEKDGQKVAYTYDAAGRVLSKTIDPEGLCLTSTFQYDALGRTLRTTEGHLEQQFYYNEQGQLIKLVVDPNGLNLTTLYEYDPQGHITLETKKNPQGVDRVTAFVWDSLGHCIEKIEDPKGLSVSTKYEFDASGRNTAMINAKGHRTQFIYSSDDTLRYQIDPRGVVTEYRYHPFGLKSCQVIYANRVETGEWTEETLLRALKADAANDAYTFYFYDQSQRLSVSVDALMIPTLYAYDAAGNLITETTYDYSLDKAALLKGKWPVVSNAKAQRQKRNIYDGLNRLIYKISPEGTVMQNQYNAAGLCIATHTFSISLREEQMYEWSEACIKPPLAADLNVRHHLFAYDAAGRVIAERNPLGAVTTYDYDALGRRIATNQYRVPLSSHLTEDWVSIYRSQPPERQTRFVYDACGRELYRISPKGHVLARCYDALGNVTCETRLSKVLASPLVSLDALSSLEASDLEARRQINEYDALGRLQKHIEDGLETVYRYDALSLVTEKRDAQHATWSYRYDEAGKLIESHSPEVLYYEHTPSGYVSQKKSIVTQYRYDSFGNCIEQIEDALGLRKITSFTFDAKHQKLATLYPETSIDNSTMIGSAERMERMARPQETYRYNAFGECVEITHCAGEKTHQFYDRLGRLRLSIGALGETTEHVYNAFGEVTQKIVYAHNEGIHVDPSWTLLDAKQALKRSSADRKQSFTYNATGQVLSVVRDEVRTYDSITQTYRLLKPTTLYEYNIFGEMVSQTIQQTASQAATTTYAYNEEGQKIAEHSAEGYLSVYEHDAFGQMIATVQYAKRQPSPLSLDRLIEDEHDRRVLFKYDARGLLIEKTQKGVHFQEIDASGQPKTVCRDLVSQYVYDALGHLVMTKDALGNTAYAYYNLLGQVIAKVGEESGGGRAATTFSYDALGQLVETRQWANGVSHADLSGFSPLQAHRDDRVVQTVFNALGQKQSETNANAHTVYYSYDLQGRLARQFEATSAISGREFLDKRYFYDASGRLIRQVTFDGALRQHAEETVYNAFGEVIQTGRNGVMRVRYDYDALGRLWRSNADGLYQVYLYDLTDKVTQTITASNGFVPDVSVERGDYSAIDLSQDYVETLLDFNQDTYKTYFVHKDNVYDRMGRLIATRQDGRRRGVDFDEAPHAIVERFEYDGFGNLVVHQSARGFETRYEYNEVNALLRQCLPEVKVMDEHGVQQTIAPEIRYTVDALGRKTGMIDANGHFSYTVLNASGQVLREVDAKGHAREKQYDHFGQQKKLKDETGHEIQYVYDGMNHLKTIIEAKGGTYYEYDETGLLLMQQERGHLETRYRYDALGHMTQKTEAGRTTTYSYDDWGQKVIERDALGHEMRWQYDDNGRMVMSQDLSGHQTHYQYNINGQLIRETSTRGKAIHYHYYNDGKLAKMDDEAQREVLQYHYDEEGHLSHKLSSVVGQWVVENDFYDYDSHGRLTRLRRYTPDSTTTTPKEESLLSVDYDYDAMGNIRHTHVKARMPRHEEKVQDDYFKYDENNRMTVNKGRLEQGQIVIGADKGTAIAYDARGQVQKALKYEHGAMQEYVYHYDTRGQLTRTLKNGHDLQAKIYDDFSRLEKEISYTEKGELFSSQHFYYQAENLNRQTLSDHKGQLISESDYHYDAMGHLTVMNHHVARQGKQAEYWQTHRYEYELLEGYQQKRDHLEQRVNGSAVTSGQTVFNYDLNGQLASVQDQTGRVTTRYYTSKEGVKGRVDDSGQTNYLIFNGTNLGSLSVDAQNQQHLEIQGGFSPSGTFAEIAKQKRSGRDKWYHPKPEIRTPGSEPLSPGENLGGYTLQAGETLEHVAFVVYGDSSLWYLIADANGVMSRGERAGESGSALQVGRRLIIPPVSTRQHHSSITRSMRSNWLGSVDARADAAMVSVPVPHRARHSFLKALGKIFVAVAATFATVLTAGVAGTAMVAGIAALKTMSLSGLVSAGMATLSGGMGLTGGALTGFAAGFVGSMVSQAGSRALNLSSGMSLKSAMIAGVANGAASLFGQLVSTSETMASLAHELQASSTSLFNLNHAAQMMGRDVLSQSVDTLLQKHQHVDWLTVGVTGLTAGVMANQPIRRLHEIIEERLGRAGQIITQGTDALAQGAISQASLGTPLDMQSLAINETSSLLGQSWLEAFSSSMQQTQEELQMSRKADAALERMEEEAKMARQAAAPSNAKKKVESKGLKPQEESKAAEEAKKREAERKEAERIAAVEAQAKRAEARSKDKDFPYLIPVDAISIRESTFKYKFEGKVSSKHWLLVYSKEEQQRIQKVLKYNAAQIWDIRANQGTPVKNYVKGPRTHPDKLKQIVAYRATSNDAQIKKNLDNLQPFVLAAHKKYPRVKVALINAIIYTESKGDWNAVSRTGALGVMQLTAAHYYNKNGSENDFFNPFNAPESIMRGTRHLNNLMNRYGSDEASMVKVVAAYNYGEGAVNKAIKTVQGTNAHWHYFLSTEAQKYVHTIKGLFQY